jgi:hypothetical protein
MGVFSARGDKYAAKRSLSHLFVVKFKVVYRSYSGYSYRRSAAFPQLFLPSLNISGMMIAFLDGGMGGFRTALISGSGVSLSASWAWRDGRHE